MDITHRFQDRCRVVELSGDLDPDAAERVSRELRAWLLDSAAPVLCDLSGVTAFSRAALGVFPAVLAAVGGWPVVSFAMIGASGPLREALRATGVARRVPIFDEGVLAGGPPYDWRPQVLARSSSLSYGTRAPAEARHEVGVFCDVAGCDPDGTDDARLVVSELTSNAVLHGGPPIELRLMATGTMLAIGVSDGSVTPPRAVAARSDSGRGLALVESIAADWGCASVPGDGKVVTARLRLR